MIELARPWGELQTVARTFVRRILKGDRTDPLFRLYDKLLRHDPGLSTHEYEEILAEAQRRGDAAAERMLREAATGPPWLPAAGPDAFGDDADEAGDFAQLVAFLAALPESELPSIRRHKPKGMPRQLFDALIAMARDVRPLPAPRPRSPRRQRSTPKPKPAPETKPAPKNDLAPKPKPAPKTPDPFQADLF